MLLNYFGNHVARGVSYVLFFLHHIYGDVSVCKSSVASLFSCSSYALYLPSSHCSVLFLFDFPHFLQVVFFSDSDLRNQGYGNGIRLGVVPGVPSHRLFASHFLWVQQYSEMGRGGRARFWRVWLQTPNSVSFWELIEFREASSVSAFQPIICVPKRTHRVSRRTHRVCRRTQ